MPLETAIYISDLNASNPIGATDPLSSADDHLRLLKSTIKASFPGVTGAVNSTHTQLNNLNSLAAVSVLANATGGAAAPAALAAGADGQALARLAGALTWSSDFARLSQANPFTANPSITVAGLAAILLNNSLNNATDQARITFQTNTANRAFVGVGDIITGSTRTDLNLASTGAVRFSGDGGASAMLSLSSAGLVTTPGASAAEVGTAGIPQNSQAVTYTTLLTDRNKNVHQTGATKTFTIDDTLAYPVGTFLTFTGNNATGTTITCSTPGNLHLAGTASTGARTLAQYGIATAFKEAAGEWVISGAGLS